MIYYLYKDDHLDQVCALCGTMLVDAFKRHGCVAINESEFINARLCDDDTVIICISLKKKDVIDKLCSSGCKKALHSNDECKSDGALFRTQLELCRELGINVIINAYPSKRNIGFLTEAGINTITMPNSSKQRVVDYSKKDIDILVSGQLDCIYYPTRYRIFNALRNKKMYAKLLMHSGMSSSIAVHLIYGERYYQLLDRCWLGVTCKAGDRDRMVPKYIEFGSSKVLPVGDCPSYMPEEMSNNMIVINDYDDDRIVSMIRAVLNDKQELVKRSEAYSKQMSLYHDLDTNVIRTLKMLANNEYDS